ncbi:glycosyltransferase family 25 protein [uncultured Hoeflea sp.]|uniref:glycosyltransferase family 25 protein n=1 Tax=uncultured Hoeflea sp. TaxID=538666 RepID=UPI002625E660|nr:glycosyltransferase family 25 protein [uncultured Hoeflea sp.]
MSHIEQIPIFVINLARSTARMKILDESASGSSVTLTRIEAVDGRTVPQSEWVDVDVAKFQRHNGRELLPGEYGCYRSHIRALEAFLESNQPYGIVLEDDVRLDDRFLGRVEAMIEAVADFDVIKLMNHRAVGFVHLLSTEKGDALGRTCFGPQGSAAAYLVSRDGAQKMLQQLRVMDLPWDVAMERYWRIDLDLLSARSNILEFSELRAESEITIDYQGSKFGPIRRLQTFLSRTREHFGRFFHSAAGRRDKQLSAVHPDAKSGPRNLQSIVAGIAIMLFISAIWMESDVYRYAGVFLAVGALFNYFRKEVWTYSRAYIGYAGLFCLFWALYAGCRLAYDIIVHPERGSGSAEGIYMFSLFYPALGYALWRYCRRPFPVVVSAIAISLVALIASTNFPEMLDGFQKESIAHNNTIHAANACGFILIFAICFADHVSVKTGQSIMLKIALLLLALAVGTLAMWNILTLGSKGVWMSIFVVLPFLALSMLLREVSGKRGLSARSIGLAIAVLIAGAMGVWAFMPQLQLRASGAVAIISSLLESTLSGVGPVAVIETFAVSPDVPTSLRERLQLWSSALAIWQEHPWFGAGVGWRSIWDASTVLHAKQYNIFHNGYLEILVRYGVTGLAAYAVMLGFAMRKVYCAAQSGLVGRSTFVCYSAAVLFFLLGNLTNSNIRLAIGESFLWFAVGFGFYCSYLLQERGIERPKSWI